MKTFLEEYGFVILIAIVVILLIVIATPVGNSVKSSILGLVDDFNGKTTAKIDKTSKETNTTLKGSELTIESTSETDKYVAILRGYQGGKEVSVASVGDKLTCTDNMRNTATFDDVTVPAETSGGLAKFNIVNGDKLDENTKYYIEIMNIGTGEIFKSDIVTMEHRKLGGSNTIDMAHINNAFASGDFSAQGSLVTVNGVSYRVLESNGTQAKLLAMDSYKNAYFGDNNTYSGSTLETEMTNYYNELPVEVQDAIVEQNINQSKYNWNPGTSDSASFSSWGKKYFIESNNSGNNYYLTRTTETNVGNRKVYALDIDDVISYLGSTATPQEVNELFFNQRLGMDRWVWLRSNYAEDTDHGFFIDGRYGAVNNNSTVNSKQYEVRPAFVLDLSLLS